MQPSFICNDFGAIFDFLNARHTENMFVASCDAMLTIYYVALDVHIVRLYFPSSNLFIQTLSCFIRDSRVVSRQ